MYTYIILIRGINVGGKNKIPMAGLRQCLEDLGFSDVMTYIASGNAILRSERSADAVARLIEVALPKNFRLDSELVRVLVLSQAKLRSVIEQKPEGFGEQPEKYHSDVIFLMGIDAPQALSVFHPREGVDRVWPGKGVIYSERLSALRTRSRLSRIAGTPEYRSMTIRNWNTTTKLLAMLEQ